MWLAYWHAPISAFCSPCGLERTEGSSYRLLLSLTNQMAIIKNLIYPNIPSALRPFEDDDSLPVPKPPQQWALHEEELTSTFPKDEPGPSCSSVDPDETNCTSSYIAG